MPTQRHSVTPHPVETPLTCVKSGEADLVDTALLDSALFQSEAIPQVVSEAKDKMVALPGQFHYGAQIPFCLWLLTKKIAAADKRGFRDCRRLGTLIDCLHSLN